MRASHRSSILQIKGTNHREAGTSNITHKMCSRTGTESIGSFLELTQETSHLPLTAPGQTRGPFCASVLVPWPNFLKMFFLVERTEIPSFISSGAGGSRRDYSIPVDTGKTPPWPCWAHPLFYFSQHTPFFEIRVAKLQCIKYIYYKRDLLHNVIKTNF